jgi:hypothetical protein
MEEVQNPSNSVKNAVSWDVASCKYFVNRRSGGTYRLHLQGRKICERGTSVSRWLPASLADFSALKIEAILPPKRRFTEYLHGVTSQMTAFFILTALKTSNLTQNIHVALFCFWQQPYHATRHLSNRNSAAVVISIGAFSSVSAVYWSERSDIFVYSCISSFIRGHL